MTGLVDRSREEIAVDLAALYETWHDDPAEDWDAVTTEVQELKDRLARLGNVNLAAIDELVAVEQRSEFLHREQDDLTRSQGSLSEVLKSIEKQSTALFLETFNTVREHFVVIFRKLFNGGKAEIVLEDETKPLECGIEIKARPPGKELRSITLLSGGERTMTAVALLFAILRSNPAPCALLDEVDAALDEDNTERFGRMLDEFLSKTQFIIVTHSKRTMDKADLLVGVTMPERGVSRRVAVKLAQIANDGTIRDIEAVNRAAAQEARAAGASARHIGRGALAGGLVFRCFGRGRRALERPRGCGKRVRTRQGSGLRSRDRAFGDRRRRGDVGRGRPGVSGGFAQCRLLRGSDAGRTIRDGVDGDERATRRAPTPSCEYAKYSPDVRVDAEGIVVASYAGRVAVTVP